MKTNYKKIAADGKLQAYKHSGFWRPMDTMRDKTELNQYWESGNAPWKVWDNQNTFAGE